MRSVFLCAIQQKLQNLTISATEFLRQLYRTVRMHRRDFSRFRQDYNYRKRGKARAFAQQRNRLVGNRTQEAREGQP